MGTLYMKPFGKSDPRLKLALEAAEPRVHFALNCGAKSCPPIKTFSAEEVSILTVFKPPLRFSKPPFQIESQLDLATESYLENDDAVKIDVENTVVHLSMLFKWYQRDFGKDSDEVLKWIYDRLNDEDKKKGLGEIVQSEAYKIEYIPYDWGNNKKE